MIAHQRWKSAKPWNWPKAYIQARIAWNELKEGVALDTISHPKYMLCIIYQGSYSSWKLNAIGSFNVSLLVPSGAGSSTAAVHQVSRPLCPVEPTTVGLEWWTPKHIPWCAPPSIHCYLPSHQHLQSLLHLMVRGQHFHVHTHLLIWYTEILQVNLASFNLNVHTDKPDFKVVAHWMVWVTTI